MTAPSLNIRAVFASIGVALLLPGMKARPPDEVHRFGHGNAEVLVATFEVVLISISAFGLAVRAIQQWIAGGRTAEAQDAIVISAIAMAAT